MPWNRHVLHAQPLDLALLGDVIGVGIHHHIYAQTLEGFEPGGIQQPTAVQGRGYLAEVRNTLFG